MTSASGTPDDPRDGTPAPGDPASTDPARTLRIGHAERDEVIETLREAAAEGRLDTEELTERIEGAVSAKFYVDLDPLVADLPVPPPSDAVRRRAELRRTHDSATSDPTGLVAGGLPRPPAHLARPEPRADEPGWSVDDPLVLRATWENERRRGRWSVPPFIRLEPVAASTEINFLEVSTDLQVIEVEILAGMGSSTVVVPEDWGVNVDRLSSSWGTVKSRVSALPAEGRPLVRVSGSVGMATFTARHAGYFERKRLEK
ncbi:DUF1707 SHOCT-like domain-containing protein [Brevibacterium litoralis]|uniref:DUF1707 SHOCT-like domain-containing protein n=1 Tax=Brevibacterium litoralis TaxID=3138935 RepID=UPI0032ED1A5F